MPSAGWGETGRRVLTGRPIYLWLDPYEWCFSMLLDSGLLQLRLQHWSRYAQEYEHVDDLRPLKEAWLRDFLGRYQPRSVVDLGCNTGAYSMLAARLGARVVAVDGSHDCIERLYRAAAAESLPVLPLLQLALFEIRHVPNRRVIHAAARHTEQAAGGLTFGERPNIFLVVPDENYPPPESTLSPVNTFRHILSSITDQDWPALPNRHYYATWQQPFDFIPVTMVP